MPSCPHWSLARDFCPCGGSGRCARCASSYSGLMSFSRSSCRFRLAEARCAPLFRDCCAADRLRTAAPVSAAAATLTVVRGLCVREAPLVLDCGVVEQPRLEWAAPFGFWARSRLRVSGDTCLQRSFRITD